MNHNLQVASPCGTRVFIVRKGCERTVLRNVLKKIKSLTPCQFRKIKSGRNKTTRFFSLGKFTSIGIVVTWNYVYGPFKQANYYYNYGKYSNFSWIKVYPWIQAISGPSLHWPELVILLALDISKKQIII